jgi:hypothetical protein
VRFFFPDSQDQVDPDFDFRTEEHSIFRVRQRDDRYAHEVLAQVPFDGVLVSKSIIDGNGTAAGKYTGPQRTRLYREGIRRFLRLDAVRDRYIQTMGDCGAFAYVREEEPPFTIDEVIDFYEDASFDLGISVDHVILGFRTDDGQQLLIADEAMSEWERRRQITLQYASEFLAQHRARSCRFQPLGVAQGWSPSSYRDSVAQLQRMGYARIALGGMVPLKTHEILSALKAIVDVRDPGTQFHLLGVTRVEHVDEFAAYGVSSFDSTSPFRQAFKDDRDNYYLPDRALTAVRVPQVEGNPRLKSRIQAGEVDQGLAVKLEERCLSLLRDYDRGEALLDDAVSALAEYEFLWDGKHDRSSVYRETLRDRPWKQCDCGICGHVGIEVVLFRGSERNKRRGFHNLYVFSRRLQREIEASELAVSVS